MANLEVQQPPISFVSVTNIKQAKPCRVQVLKLLAADANPLTTFLGEAKKIKRP